jgi:hypothetical protein
MVLIITTWERGYPGASQNRPFLMRGVRVRYEFGVRVRYEFGTSSDTSS